MKIIIIIIGLQPSDRLLAPTPSISPYPQPSSSFLHTRIPLFLRNHYLLLLYLNRFLLRYESSFKSLIASFRSVIIPFLGCPCRLFPIILPFITSFNNPSPLSTCPIQFFFLLLIVLIKHLFSSTLSNTSSFFILSLQL